LSTPHRRSLANIQQTLARFTKAKNVPQLARRPTHSLNTEHPSPTPQQAKEPFYQPLYAKSTGNHY